MIQTKKHLDKFLTQAQGNSMKYATYPKKYEDLKVEARFGQGKASNVPFISLLAGDMQTSNGYYPVYLYYKDFNVLILAFGQSETHIPEITWSDNIRSKYPTIKEFFKPNKPFRYGDSFVFKAYQVSVNEDWYPNNQSSDMLKYLHPDKVIYLGLSSMEEYNDEFAVPDQSDSETGELISPRDQFVRQTLRVQYMKKNNIVEGRGRYSPLHNLLTKKELATDLKDMYNIYQEELNRKIVYIDRNLDDSKNNYEKEEFSVLEGSPKLIAHFKRERNQKIVKKKKEQFKKRFGSIYCQVCDFNFKDKYGDHGQDFIECHHIIPISEMKEDHKTELKHLILLCANCHRMVHRDPKKVLTPQELNKIYTE